MIDGALTSKFDEATSLAIGIGWLAVLLLAATVLLRDIAGSPARNHPAGPARHTHRASDGHTAGVPT